MKATQSENPFRPVTLLLETQHEVDALYALLNWAPTSDAVGFTTQFEHLTPFASKDKTYIEELKKRFPGPQ